MSDLLDLLAELDDHAPRPWTAGNCAVGGPAQPPDRTVGHLRHTWETHLDGTVVVHDVPGPGSPEEACKALVKRWRAAGRKVQRDGLTIRCRLMAGSSEEFELVVAYRAPGEMVPQRAAVPHTDEEES